MNSDPISRNDRLVGALYGSFVGDSLCLAPHWIYDPAEIEAKFGRITDYADPSLNPYHSGRQRGEFTHYGDQTFCLMQSINHAEGFSIETFAAEWRAMWPGYSGYVDGATKATLRNGHSDSHDLSGASRIAPLVVGLHDEDEESLLEAVTAQTSMTHGHPEVIDAARFFALLTRRLIDGNSWEESFATATDAPYPSLVPAKWIAAAQKMIKQEPAKALDQLGRACSLEDALPASLYFLQRDVSNFARPLEENAMAGGDSAARGMLIGMVLGALHGVGRIPESWIQGLKAQPLIANWLKCCGLDSDT